MSRSVVPWLTEYIIRQNFVVSIKHSLLQSNRSYVCTYTSIEEIRKNGVSDLYGRENK